MRTTVFQMLKTALLLMILIVAAGCSGTGADTNSTANSGAITAKLAWPQAAGAAKAAAPAGVSVVRVIVGADDMQDIQQDFDAAAGSGVIAGVPAGSGRTLKVQGLNAAGALTHRGSAAYITVRAGQTTDAGTIVMQAIPVPATPGLQGAGAFPKSDTAIDFVWSAELSNDTVFTVERKTGAAGAWAVLGTAVNYLIYQDSGLTPGTTYYYRVKAGNGNGDSDWSPVASATTTGSNNNNGGGTTGTVQLPRTGQTTSYAAGDDGALQKGAAWPTPRFTDNTDGTVTDNLTGLIWLKNANCFSTKNWADALTSANSLASGACGLSDGSVAGDWRLPNVVELESLVDVSKSGPALPAGRPFTAVKSYEGYWSSSTRANNTSDAWYVLMSYGNVYEALKGFVFNEIYVWPVRDSKTPIVPSVQLPKTGQSTCYDSNGIEVTCAGSGQDGEKQAGIAWDADTRFTDNSNGTITDNLTGLVWLKNANCTDTVAGIAKNSGSLNWTNALVWSSNLASGVCGLTDGSQAGQWRLPNRKELQSLVDRSRYNPALPSGHPFAAVQSNVYWSSSASRYGYDGYSAWYVSMGDGYVNDYYKTTNYYVWPVRAGQ